MDIGELKQQDKIVWRARRGWRSKGVVLEVDFDKYKVKVDLLNSKGTALAVSNFNKARYWINISNIVEVNGVAVNEEQTTA